MSTISQINTKIKEEASNSSSASLNQQNANYLQDQFFSSKAKPKQPGQQSLFFGNLGPSKMSDIKINLQQPSFIASVNNNLNKTLNDTKKPSTLNLDLNQLDQNNKQLENLIQIKTSQPNTSRSVDYQQLQNNLRNSSSNLKSVLMSSRINTENIVQSQSTTDIMGSNFEALNSKNHNNNNTSGQGTPVKLNNQGSQNCCGGNSVSKVQQNIFIQDNNEMSGKGNLIEDLQGLSLNFQANNIYQSNQFFALEPSEIEIFAMMDFNANSGITANIAGITNNKQQKQQNNQIQNQVIQEHNEDEYDETMDERIIQLEEDQILQAAVSGVTQMDGKEDQYQGNNCYSYQDEMEQFNNIFDQHCNISQPSQSLFKVNNKFINHNTPNKVSLLENLNSPSKNQIFLSNKQRYQITNESTEIDSDNHQSTPKSQNSLLYRHHNLLSSQEINNKQIANKDFYMHQQNQLQPLFDELQQKSGHMMQRQQSTPNFFLNNNKLGSRVLNRQSQQQQQLQFQTQQNQVQQQQQQLIQQINAQQFSPLENLLQPNMAQPQNYQQLLQLQKNQLLKQQQQKLLQKMQQQNGGDWSQLQFGVQAAQQQLSPADHLLIQQIQQSAMQIGQQAPNANNLMKSFQHQKNQFFQHNKQHSYNDLQQFAVSSNNTNADIYSFYESNNGNNNNNPHQLQSLSQLSQESFNLIKSSSQQSCNSFMNKSVNNDLYQQQNYMLNGMQEQQQQLVFNNGNNNAFIGNNNLMNNSNLDYNSQNKMLIIGQNQGMIQKMSSHMKTNSVSSYFQQQPQMNAQTRQSRGKQKLQTVNQQEEIQFEIEINNILADKRCTLMIKNIPNRYTKDQLLQLIESQFKNQFDFFYLPIDIINKCNLGYAFINFYNVEQKWHFYQFLNGKPWPNSQKVCKITYAKLQGQKELIQHFSSTTVMRQMDDSIKPYIVSQQLPADDYFSQ